MKPARPAGPKVPRLLKSGDLAQVSAGDGDGVAGIFKLKQHVDNPGQ